jgi:hypothetical protein
LSPDKRIQLARIERDIEEHHKLDRITDYTRDHVVILQGTFGIFFNLSSCAAPKT